MWCHQIEQVCQQTTSHERNEPLFRMSAVGDVFDLVDSWVQGNPLTQQVHVNTVRPGNMSHGRALAFCGGRTLAGSVCAFGRTKT